jgi:hypothetical protein
VARDRQKWGIVVGIAAVVLFCWGYLTSPDGQHAGSDGYYTYVFARSLVYDGDFDFSNDYQICGDPHGKNRDEGGGHPENPFYVGPTIYWAPAMWVAKHVIRLPKDAPPADVNACRGPLSKWTLFMGPVLGGLTLFIAYRIARRVASDGPAALATALLGFGQPIVGYAFVWPHYAHVYDAFSCAVFLLLSLRAAERPRSWLRWALVALFAGVCYLQRPPAVLFGVVPLALAVVVLWKQWWRLAGVLAILAVGLFVTGLWPQALLYKYLYGRYWLGGSPISPYYVQLAHAHPWLSLFDPHGGLFYSTPTAWFAVLGIVPALRIKPARPFIVSALGAMVLIVYVSSAALDWNSSSSFSNRRLTALVAVFVPLAAVWLERVRRWLLVKRSRPLVALGLAVLVPSTMLVFGDALTDAEMTSTIERAMSQEELYGLSSSTVWKIMDRNVGDLFILPAEIVFRIRYGLKMNAFRDVCEPWVVHEYRLTTIRFNVPALTDPRWTKHVTGMQQDPAGLKMTAKRSTLVYAAMWPFATRLDVAFKSKLPAHVTVARGRYLLPDQVYGTVDLPGGDQPVSAGLPIPSGAYDSGLVEIVVRSDDAPGAEIEMTQMAVIDTNTYPNARQ